MEETTTEIMPEPETDVQEIVNSLVPHIVLNEDKSNIQEISFDVEPIKKTIDSIKNRGARIILQSGGELGINVLLESRTKDIAELKTMAESSLLFLRDNIPIKKMLGVC